MRYFSQKEAEALIPELEKIYSEIAKLAAKAMEKAQKVKILEDNPAKTADCAIERSQLQFLSNHVNTWLQKIVDLGGMPKGVDPALVDFPHRLEGKEVYLCWRLGEKRITHFHGLDEGFAGRRPLPGARLAE